MAFEDVITQGSKGTNGPWQRAVLQLLHSISISTGGSSGIPGVPGMIRATGAGTIPSGTFSASFFNGGATNAVVLGAPLKPGEEVNFGMPSGLTAISYDGTGTDLLITTIS